MLNAEELENMELEADLYIRSLFREWTEVWEDTQPAPFVLGEDYATNQ